MNLTALRSLVRTDLGDTSAAAYRWEDDTLDRHLLRAAAEYSLTAPQQLSITLDTIAGSRVVDITSIEDRVNIESVEYPVALEPRALRRFNTWGQRLTVEDGAVPDGQPLSICYGAPHLLDETGTTIPAVHHEIVVAGAAAYAAIEWAAFAVNRVNSGEDAAGGYFRWGSARLATFQSELKRLHWNNGVRIGKLFNAEM
ncbi:MAG: hypothetical protein ACRKGH_06935 [Dehalogenimonas sp.]